MLCGKWKIYVKIFSSSIRLLNTEFVDIVTLDFSKHDHTKRAFSGRDAKGLFYSIGRGNKKDFEYEIRVEFTEALNLDPLTYRNTLCLENDCEAYTNEFNLDADQAFLMGLIDKEHLLTHRTHAPSQLFAGSVNNPARSPPRRSIRGEDPRSLFRHNGYQWEHL